METQRQNVNREKRMRRNIWKRWIAGISVVMMVMSGMSDVLPTSAAEIASTQASASSQASSAASEAGTEASVSESEETEDKVTDTATGLTEDAAAGSEAVSEDAADAASSEENAEVSASASTERSEEYPAVDFGTESAGNMKVSISAPEGAFPKGTTVSVTPVSLGSSVENEVTDQVEESGKQATDLFAVDISFADADGNEIEPKKEISVQFVSDQLQGSTAEVYHVSDDGDVTHAATKEDADASAVEISADSFSVYVCALTAESDGETYTIDYHYDYEGSFDADKTDLTGMIASDLTKITLSDGKGMEHDGFLIKGWTTVKDGSSIEYDLGSTDKTTTLPAGLMKTVILICMQCGQSCQI
jgi:hypothetical protein